MAVSVLRCIALYFSVVLAVRIMGKRQIGQLQPSELVIAIMISELAALPLQDLDMPLLWGIMPMFVVVALELLTSFAALKSMGFRAFFYGRPVVLINNGRVHQYNLLRTRVSMEDIMEVMRSNAILKIEDIQVAVLETNGTISVVPKPQTTPPSADDLGMKVKENGGIPLILVMNGVYVKRNLAIQGLDETDVSRILKGYEVPLDQVFMLTIDDRRKTYLIKQENL